MKYSIYLYIILFWILQFLDPITMVSLDKIINDNSFSLLFQWYFYVIDNSSITKLEITTIIKSYAKLINASKTILTVTLIIIECEVIKFIN